MSPCSIRFLLPLFDGLGLFNLICPRSIQCYLLSPPVEQSGLLTNLLFFTTTSASKYRFINSTSIFVSCLEIKYQFSALVRTAQGRQHATGSEFSTSGNVFGSVGLIMPPSTRGQAHTRAQDQPNEELTMETPIREVQPQDAQENDVVDQEMEDDEEIVDDEEEGFGRSYSR